MPVCLRVANWLHSQITCMTCCCALATQVECVICTRWQGALCSSQPQKVRSRDWLLCFVCCSQSCHFNLLDMIKQVIKESIQGKKAQQWQRTAFPLPAAGGRDDAVTPSAGVEATPSLQQQQPTLNVPVLAKKRARLFFGAPGQFKSYLFCVRP